MQVFMRRLTSEKKKLDFRQTSIQMFVFMEYTGNTAGLQVDG